MMNGLEWNDLRLILAIGRAGSLAGAARDLQNDHSTVFRKLNGIEKRTGVRFFERLNGRYEITEAGEAAVGIAETFENEVLGLEREIIGRDTRLQGNIRLSSVEGLALNTLPRLLAGFRRQNPDVTLELVSDSDTSDLARREADVALRATMSPPDSSLGRFICDFAIGAYASPGYLAASGRRALADHDWVVFQPSAHWINRLLFPSEDAMKARTVLSTNSVIFAAEAAREGIGAVAIPCFLCDRDPDFVRIAGPFPEMMMQLWVLTHPDLRHTARVTALMDYLARHLRRDQALFEGNGTTA